MAMTDNAPNTPMEVTFTHPRDSTSKKVRCSAIVTAAQAIEQLVKQGFIEAPNKTTTYTLVRDGKAIAPNATFGSAGVSGGDTIAVTESNSLAAEAPCRA
jgi:hypothetical protein